MQAFSATTSVHFLVNWPIQVGYEYHRFPKNLWGLLIYNFYSPDAILFTQPTLLKHGRKVFRGLIIDNCKRGEIGGVLVCHYYKCALVCKLADG